MSGQWHPDTEAIADFEAGLASGLRARRLAVHIAGCARCVTVRDQLGAVSSVLASVPTPSLPDAFERRITAALAAEVTARADAAREGAAAAASPAAAVAGQDSADQVVPEGRAWPTDLIRAPRAPRTSRTSRTSGRRGHRFRPALVIAPVAACLLAGFGYLLTNVGASSTASGPDNAAAPAVTSGARAASPALLSPGRNAISEPLQHAAFVVIASGVDYRQATLGAQVRAELAARHGASAKVPAPSAIPSASAGFGGASNTSGSTAGAAPSRALVGCVLHLTGGAAPSFVDRATYQGEPVYVIAVPDKAWVVGLGCTASQPDLITSVSLGTAR